MMENEFDFNEYQRIALFTYNKYFKSFFEYKDDLLSSGYLYMWKNRNNYKNSNFARATCMFNHCYWGMLSFLKSINGNKRKPKINERCCISMDTPINKDDEDMTLADCLGEEFDFCSNLNLEFLVKACQECKSKIKVYKDNKFTFKIIDFIIQGVRDIDIANKLKCTRQLVSSVHKKFCSLLKEEMLEKDFCI